LEPIILVFAFIAGLLFRSIGYPPLPGYLLAGFLSHALGIGDIELISSFADVGITLLLFTIGLKLNIRELVTPQVWGVGLSQIIIVVPLTTMVIVGAGLLFPELALADPTAAWTLAFALSFSSTVFAVKIFEEKGETASLHANLAIGILVIQDVLAVIYLVASSGHLPSPYAIPVLILLLLLKPVLMRILSAAGHGELLVLFGITIAIGAGALFEMVDLKAGLGALITGVVLGNTSKSKELYKSLISLKDLFLIGFFLQIGYYGLPSTTMILVAVALALLIFLRPIIYYLLFVLFGLRAWTALLASSALFNYSEFGLIVAALATEAGILPPQWLTTIALALSLSFFLATPFNTNIHTIYNRFGPLLRKFERGDPLPEEISGSLGNADIVILGMGRVGQGAYRYMQANYEGHLIGVEEDYEKSIALHEEGFHCIHGDASDHNFWSRASLNDRKLILVSLTNHSENMSVIKLIRQSGYENKLAVISRYQDERDELESMGIISFNLYGEAGHGFAEHVLLEIGEGPSPGL